MTRNHTHATHESRFEKKNKEVARKNLYYKNTVIFVVFHCG